MGFLESAAKLFEDEKNEGEDVIVCQLIICVLNFTFFCFEYYNFVFRMPLLLL